MNSESELIYRKAQKTRVNWEEYRRGYDRCVNGEHVTECLTDSERRGWWAVMRASKTLGASPAQLDGLVQF